MCVRLVNCGVEGTSRVLDGLCGRVGCGLCNHIAYIAQLMSSNSLQ